MKIIERSESAEQDADLRQAFEESNGRSDDLRGAAAFQADDEGSIPFTRSTFFDIGLLTFRQKLERMFSLAWRWEALPWAAFSLLFTALLIAAAIATGPRCTPADPGLRLGGMLMAGCAERKIQ